MSNDRSSSAPPAPPAGFSIVRVAILVIIVAAVGTPAFLMLNSEEKPPQRFPFTGQVLYNGQPVAVGSVLSQSVDNVLETGLGPLDAEGKFSLDTNGEPGVAVGKHRIVISALSSGFPPRPVVPVKYVDMSTSPLMIEVTEDASKNTVIFNLEGELPEAPAAPPGPTEPPANSGASASQSPGEPNPTADAPAATSPQDAPPATTEPSPQGG